MSSKIQRLEKLAKTIRQDVLKISHHGHIGHVGSALSVVDILTGLYFSVSHSGDRILLSKGHACAALYCCLYRKGLIDKKTLYTYHTDGTKLAAHPEIHLAGVDFSSGSLGHGLSVGSGMALAVKLKQKPNRIFVILSDGECDEGSTWEAALVAGHRQLNNLTAIIDYNRIQAFGRVSQVTNLEPFKAKWQAFGWRVVEADGHNLGQLITALTKPPSKKQPTVVLAHTILGKGISFMENRIEWHYLDPTDEQFNQGILELRS